MSFKGAALMALGTVGGMMLAALVVAMIALMMQSSPAEAKTHYTEEELQQEYAGKTVRVLLSIRESDGDTWVYVNDARTKGQWKALNADIEGEKGYWSDAELEEMHDNTLEMLVTVETDDGRTHTYAKNARTKGHFKAVA